MGQAEGRQETDEAGGTGGDSSGSVSGSAKGKRLVPEQSRRQQFKATIREYAEAIVIAILLALFIRTFVVQAFKIPSGSMIPTLEVGDHILVNKFLFGTKIPLTDISFFPVRKPQRNDIIVFKYPEDETKDFIKRVIGVPGDIVEITDKRVSINGKELKEPFTIYQDPSINFSRGQKIRDNYGPVSVPEDSYFVMGDNRDRSLDSRFWGMVKAEKIKGRAFLIYLSWNKETNSMRWGRLGQSIF